MPEISSSLQHHGEMTDPINTDIGVIVVYVKWPRCCYTDQDPHDEEEYGSRQCNLALHKVYLKH
jgi:hypothetical protein